MTSRPRPRPPAKKPTAAAGAAGGSLTLKAAADGPPLVLSAAATDAALVPPALPDLVLLPPRADDSAFALVSPSRAWTLDVPAGADGPRPLLEYLVHEPVPTARERQAAAADGALGTATGGGGGGGGRRRRGEAATSSLGGTGAAVGTGVPGETLTRDDDHLFLLSKYLAGDPSMATRHRRGGTAAAAAAAAAAHRRPPDVRNTSPYLRLVAADGSVGNYKHWNAFATADEVLDEAAEYLGDDLPPAPTLGDLQRSAFAAELHAEFVRLGRRPEDRRRGLEAGVEDVPRTAEPVTVTRRYLLRFRLPVWPPETARTCARGDMCLFLRRGASYVGREFWEPGQAPPAANVPDTGPGGVPRRLCLDCLLFYWTQRCLVAAPTPPTEAINTFQVAGGEYAEHCLLPPHLPNGAPTGIVGFVPCYDAVHRVLLPITPAMAIEYGCGGGGGGLFLAECNMDFRRASAGPTSA